MSAKLSIIGSGRVGAATAYTLIHGHVVDEIVLLDVVKELADGHAADISHSISWNGGKKVFSGVYEDIKGSDIVIITAGLARKPRMSRLDLVKVNAKIIKDIVTNVKKHAADSIVIILTNPVDLMTYFTWKISGFPKQRIIGQGGVLDSMRFRYAISKVMKTGSKNIKAYVLGEHGDGKIPIFSNVKVGDKKLEFTLKEKENIVNEMEMGNLDVIKKKGGTEYAPAVALTKMVESILLDKKEMLPCSAVLDGEYEIKGISIGVPVILGKGGILKVEEWNLSNDELGSLKKSAENLRLIYNKFLANIL